MCHLDFSKTILMGVYSWCPIYSKNLFFIGSQHYLKLQFLQIFATQSRPAALASPGSFLDGEVQSPPQICYRIKVTFQQNLQVFTKVKEALLFSAKMSPFSTRTVQEQLTHMSYYLPHGTCHAFLSCLERSLW